jgi:hypothetical protein
LPLQAVLHGTGLLGKVRLNNTERPRVGQITEFARSATAIARGRAYYITGLSVGGGMALTGAQKGSPVEVAVGIGILSLTAAVVRRRSRDNNNSAR